jgi:tRNA threonylcarbamoyladenosine biosynthesis protein TsaB
MMLLGYFINNKNVKIKNKMDRYSLIAQATYHGIQYALYHNQIVLQELFLVKTETYRLMNEFNQLLLRHNLDWSKIYLIGASQGPAPFTTLRALITTLNGISFARNIPLVPVDGLTCFYKKQAALNQNKTVIVMLNAFGNDIYYAFEENGVIKTGWYNAADFIAQQTDNKNTNTYFVGNGALLHQDLIVKHAGSFDARECPEQATLKSITEECFKESKKVLQLTPLYLKTQNFK